MTRRVAGENLPTWACMEAVVAEALSAVPRLAPSCRTRAKQGAAPTTWNRSTCGPSAAHARPSRERQTGARPRDRETPPAETAETARFFFSAPRDVARLFRATVCSARDDHIRFRSAGGSDDLANRTTLCAWHHLRGIHADRLRCSGVAPAHLRFELGIRPGRAPLLVYGPGERRAAGG